MLLVFAVVNGQPIPHTSHFDTYEQSCQQQLMVIDGINRWYKDHGVDILIYASCEPIKG